MRGCSLRYFSAKRPGAEIKIDGVDMDFAYRDYFEPLASVGYETLIYDCLIGDATLFQRADTVEARWCAVQGLLEAWRAPPLTISPTMPRRVGPAPPIACSRAMGMHAADRDRTSARATHRVKCDLLKSGARRRS